MANACGRSGNSCIIVYAAEHYYKPNPQSAMFIKQFRVQSYKSIIDSGLLEFQPGFNMIVGQNNSGKTSLLESLDFNFSNNPHRSLRTLPSRNSLYNNQSRHEFIISISKSELFERLNDWQLSSSDPKLAFAVDSRISPTDIASTFELWLQKHDNLEIKVVHQAGSEINESNVSFSGLEDFNKPYLANAGNRGEGGFFLYSYKEGKVSWDQSGNNIGINVYPLVKYCFDYFSSKVYRFVAERLHIGTCSRRGSMVLQPDGSNLPECIGIIQGQNRGLYNHLNKSLSIVFPHIKEISARQSDPASVTALVWTVDPDSNRDDLAIPLAACGTGVSQVLAILYAVQTTQEPQTFIIDEPQSFLHPGAAKKLMEILRDNKRHQYFISTHSPVILATLMPAPILSLTYEASETKIRQVSCESIAELRFILGDLGIKFSDIFGADAILWVEGPTEEEIFKAVLQKLLNFKSLSIQIISVVSTDELLHKRKGELLFELYEKVSQGGSLLPPAMGYIFDKELRSDREVEDFIRRGQRAEVPMKFIRRRMIENYFLNSEAIANVLNAELTKAGQKTISSNEVSDWILQKQLEQKYYSKGTDLEQLTLEEMQSKVDAAKLLSDLFDNLTQSSVSYRKTKHGPELANWLIDNAPEELEDIRVILSEFLTRGS